MGNLEHPNVKLRGFMRCCLGIDIFPCLFILFMPAIILGHVQISKNTYISLQDSCSPYFINNVLFFYSKYSTRSLLMECG